MSEFKTWRRFLTGWRLWVSGFVVYVLLFTGMGMIVPPPNAVGMAGERQIARNVQFFEDVSWIDDQDQRQLSQNVFDALITGIRTARHLIVLDMFLFNAWQGPVPEQHRQLSAELTQVLIEQKSAFPNLHVLVISDPINTVYGGLESVHFDALTDAGIPVVLTDLVQLQDSNPLWSSVWRWLIRPLGNASGTLLPNPFGEGRVSLRSYLALLNFKANHRKLLIADNGVGDLHGWVSSANPHDGSSAHRNVAIRFDGAAVQDLVNSERALLLMNDERDQLRALDAVLTELANGESPETDISASSAVDDSQSVRVQVVSESAIHEAVMRSINATRSGDAVDMVMFYLSERQIIGALTAARARGVNVRVLLDVNNDAFGRQKNGVPNRPVAAELVEAGVSVRWCATRGEQCHAKWLHVAQPDEHTYILGSANYTRRNLMDLNMETNLVVIAQPEHSLVNRMSEFFLRQWNNQGGRTYSTEYETHAQDSVWLTFQYRFMEFTGLSTF